MRRQLANPVGMTTATSSPHCTTPNAPFFVGIRETLVRQRTDRMIASSALGCMLCNVQFAMCACCSDCDTITAVAWGSGNECFV